ncbi:MAG: LytR/AlgR family response regulator transcription factor [Salibacteraceae bacterium]
MKDVKILIVEDENIVAKDIQYSLAQLGYGVAGIANDPETALELVATTSPSLVLMDIRLKNGASGIETAQLIRENYDIPLIYLTAYADVDTIERAKVTQPFGYITKPFSEVDLQTSIKIALYKHSKEIEMKAERNRLEAIVEGSAHRDMIFAKTHARLDKIKTADVYFVEALKDYVVIHTRNQKHTLHTTMKEISSKLPEVDFMRVHRSYIVRLDKIERIENPYIYLEDEMGVLPIGGSYKEQLIERLVLV